MLQISNTQEKTPRTHNFVVQTTKDQVVKCENQKKIHEGGNTKMKHNDKVKTTSRKENEFFKFPPNSSSDHEILQQEMKLAGSKTLNKEPWRDSLNILRTIPKPLEQDLLLRVQENETPLKNISSNTQCADYEQFTNVNLNKKHHVEDSKSAAKIKNNRKHIVHLASEKEAALMRKNKKRTKQKKSDTASVAKSFEDIMDPYVSTEKRYEQYIRDIKTTAVSDLTSLDFLNEARTLDTKSEGIPKSVAYENERKSNKSVVSHPSTFTDHVINDTDVPTKVFSKSGKLKTSDVISAVALANGPDKGYVAPPNTSQAPPISQSLSQSKAPSRVGRVSSLGLDGQMGVVSVQSDSKKESFSRNSHNSPSFPNYFDKESAHNYLYRNGEIPKQGYIYKDGEIPRKVVLPPSLKQNGSVGASSTLKGVERDVKLMEYLWKNSKALRSYNKDKHQKKVLKPIDHKPLLDKEDLVDVKGGGWKVLNSKVNRQPDFERMIPVSVVKLTCEIQTQTENLG